MATMGPPRRNGTTPAPEGTPRSNQQRDARATALSPGVMASIAARRQGVKAGFTGDWFPPDTPMPGQAPADAKGRAWDYPYGFNLAYQPRQEQGQNTVSFPVLRRLAEPALGGLDILRLIIERRKNQMKAQQFQIVGREKNDNGGPPARKFEELLRKPDGINTWRVWLGMLLEDHFVIDAPAIYFRPSADGLLFEQIDGAMLKLILDENGRTPIAPLPAYQQLTKGIPAVNYSIKEMGYYASNIRPGRIYGMSPVEQIIGIVNIALNRQLSVLNYYTAGSVPDMLIGVPKEWNPDQIEQFSLWWDSLLGGNIAARRKARFYPGDMKPFETKTEILKDVFDEWLARIVCFGFGVSAQPFIKEMNRATSETSKQQAEEDGLEPTKLFVKDVVDDILMRAGFPQLELRYKDEEIQDPDIKAKVVQAYYGGTTGQAKPLVTLDEARDMIGLSPATPDQLLELQPPPPPALDPAAGGGEGDDITPPPKGPGKKPAAGKQPPQNVTKAAKSGAGRSLPPVPANRKKRQATERGIGVVAKRIIGRQRRALVATLRGRAAKLAKASMDDLQDLLRTLDDNPWDDAARQRLRDLLDALAVERSTAALDHLADDIGGTDEEFAALLDQANEAASSWAEERVGNLITDVSDTTRDAVNELVANAVSEGLTNDELADQLSDAFGFSEDRALMIARTETANADTAGTLIGFRASGVVQGKEWAPDDNPCPDCQENADAGAIALDDDFPSGDDGPPAHPNCECTVIPVVADVGEGAGAGSDEVEEDAAAA